MKTAIIIPNFNGAELLEKNLPAVLKTNADEVIVIDDASLDTSLNVLHQFKEKVTVVKHTRNRGYGVSVNDGMVSSTADIVVLLNTDTRPNPDFLDHLIPYFTNQNIFAVSAHEPGRGWAKGAFMKGFFHHEPGEETSNAHISMYASGGSAAFSRQKFIELGLYDHLYHPFYWEDTDMSYRAWKRGWEVWWEPNAIVEHETSSTIKKYFKQTYLDFIVQRNELIFNWKNITDSKLHVAHMDAIQKRILNHPGYIKIVLGAGKKMLTIQKKHKIEQEQAKRTDQAIFALFQ